MNNFYFDFTKREKCILDLLSRGYNNKQICEKLCIANCTLTSHLEHIYQKTNLCDSGKHSNNAKRTKVVLLYLKILGFLPSDWEIKN